MTLPNVPFHMEQGDRERPTTTRPVIYGKQNVISSGHCLTSLAGVRMLMSGGNAFDAAVAATFAAAVVEPAASFSLGSECVVIIHDAESARIRTLCGQGGASGAATPEFFRTKGFDRIPTGPGMNAPLSFTTPGMVGAILSLLANHGTKTLADVLAPAISYAGEGIANYEYMISRMGADDLSQFKRFPPGGSEIFFQSGERPRPGSVLIQSSLANVLRKLVAAEASAPGSRSGGIEAARSCFYHGEIADMIAAASDRVGGVLTKADLQRFSEEYEEAASTTYLGKTVLGQSFWSQAPVALQAINILESFDLREMGFNSPSYIHTICEALKLAFADREAFYGDPNFVDVPQKGLLDKDYGRERAKLVRIMTAAPELPEPGDPWRFSGERRGSIPQPRWPDSIENPAGTESGTTHISVVDQKGNVAAVTPSGGAFVKSVFFPELGFTLSTRSEMFNLEPGHPNCVAPGKRPRTTLVSFMVTSEGVPVMTAGCPGGDAQVQANLQLLLNVLLWRMSPQEAVEAPRFATMSVPNSFYPHTYLKGQLALEDGFPPATHDRLRSMGHKVVTVPTCGMGAVVTTRDPGTGVIATSADPRRACYAIGW
jgi:gamma-glutamyltranspeptidase/glutathione hydrolase